MENIEKQIRVRRFSRPSPELFFIGVWLIVGVCFFKPVAVVGKLLIFIRKCMNSHRFEGSMGFISLCMFAYFSYTSLFGAFDQRVLRFSVSLVAHFLCPKWFLD